MKIKIKSIISDLDSNSKRARNNVSKKNKKNKKES